MNRSIRLSEKLLLAGLSLIFLFMIVHDWIPLGSLNDIEAVTREHSFKELLLTTLINAAQVALLLGFVILFMGKRYPILIKLWLIIHQSSIFIGVLMAWWLPYFLGIGAEQRAERYQQMFGNTHSFLPAMNGIVPNTIHVLFHLTLLFCIILSVFIALTDYEKKGRRTVILSEKVK